MSRLDHSRSERQGAFQAETTRERELERQATSALGAVRKKPLLRGIAPRMGTFDGRRVLWCSPDAGVSPGDVVQVGSTSVRVAGFLGERGSWHVWRLLDAEVPR
jgi:hypothetical protein